MKASILETFEKGLKIIRSLDKPEYYGPMQRWIIRFRKMYDITRSPWDKRYIYMQTLEDELSKKINQLFDEKVESYEETN